MVRYLRIIAAVFFAVMFLASSVLWARSYYRADNVSGNVAWIYLAFHSQSGMIRSSVGYEREGWSPFRFQSREVPSNARWPPTYFKWEFKNSRRGGINFDFPYWFAVVLTGGLAVATQCRRFSLRMLLIAATFVCFVLGLAVFQSR